MFILPRRKNHGVEQMLRFELYPLEETNMYCFAHALQLKLYIKKKITV